MRESLLKETKTKLLDLLKARGAISIDEITEMLGLAKTTVRQHLLLLEKQGLVTRSMRSQGKGRPQSVYQLSKTAGALFPSQEPDLLRQLLKRLLEDGHGEWVQRFFRDYWEQRAEKFRNRLANKKNITQVTILKALFELLEEEGFMPEITKRKDGALVVRECNCPFPEAVKATGIPCRLEAEFLKQILQTHLERTDHIPSGDPTCTYVASKEKKAKVQR